MALHSSQSRLGLGLGLACLTVWCVQVLLELTRQVDQDKPVLSLSVSQLGAEGKSQSFDLRVTSYLRRVTLAYCDLPGQPPSPSSPSPGFTCPSTAALIPLSSSGGRNHPLHLISSSDQQGSDLLKVDFIKVSRGAELQHRPHSVLLREPVVLPRPCSS